MNYIHLTQTLVDSFNALADEVQSLTDRKTVLEHKLRFAHEQFQYLADKHAPAAPEISETLAKLQIPPELAQSPVKSANTVPLPRRRVVDASHQIALLIRDGRRVAHQLASIAEPSKTSLSGRETFSRLSNTATSMSTAALEQDFTVEGKKGSLACPFSTLPQKNADAADDGVVEGAAPDPTPHQSTDPICAAMLEEATSQPAPSGANNKCPIRFLDKHSPEEIAHYVKTHKHELPRSHAVCVGRYQKSEDQIRKLDAKYGNIVSMIEGLSQLHKPMLPVSEEREHDEVDRDASNERVENWAQEVSANAAEFSPSPESPHGIEGSETQHDEVILDDQERESHFDRPLKEVRVGESPSRPWGISVPIYEPNEHGHNQAPLSPPPAPVLMPTRVANMVNPMTPEKRTGKCPFDHTKLAAMGGLGLVRPNIGDKVSEASHKPPTERPYTPQKQRPHDNQAATPAQPQPQPQPAFIHPSQVAKTPNGNPQMVFTGPVFIGYPMDQAIQFMQAFQGQQQQH